MSWISLESPGCATGPFPKTTISNLCGATEVQLNNLVREFTALARRAPTVLERRVLHRLLHQVRMELHGRFEQEPHPCR